MADLLKAYSLFFFFGNIFQILKKTSVFDETYKKLEGLSGGILRKLVTVFPVEFQKKSMKTSPETTE